MRCYLRSCWRTSWLFCLGLLLHTGEARVHTEVQPGPLYRVLGKSLSISCNVSGFASSDTQKEFDFRFSGPPNPSFKINIISTRDKNFGYTIYNDRVRLEEIAVKHVSPNSVLFEIKRLQKGDEGDYECRVVNSESTYDGTYSAKTTVEVIDNSLSVSSPVSTSLSYTEGDALNLTCRASSNTIQHTHLSFAWYLHKDGEDDARPVISLDRDFTLSPGQEFEGRYHAGLIRLDKTGEATYRLTVAGLELSDQGRIYCRAQEWILDPDGTWCTITQKDAGETTINIKAREVHDVSVLDTSSLAVGISTQQTALQEGQELSLSCNVDAHELERRFFSVAWLRGSVELARVGPTGVLSVGPEYSGRETELRAARTGDRDYRLVLQPVRTEDQGDYFCRAWPEDRGQDGAFARGAAQTSSPQPVSISATESAFSIEKQNNVSVNEGDRLTLTCKVDGVQGQLSVSWQHRPTSTSTTGFNDVVSLSQGGVMAIEGPPGSRKVRATRPAADTFTLELDEVTPSDSGVYKCSVSEWKTNSKTHSQSETTVVTVAPIESTVTVKLMSRNTIVTVGDNVELLCRVRGPRVPITLIWSLLHHESSTIDNILTLTWNGEISWSGDQRGYQTKVARKDNEVIHYLLINGASHREAGSYRCTASVFLENVYKKLNASDQVTVIVQNPVSTLILTSPRALTRNINGDVDIKCSVTSVTSASSRYAVTWLHRQGAENKTVVSSDRNALTAQAELSNRRISMWRTEGPAFELTIRKAQISDYGSYICEVVEWLQDPRGNWYQLSPVSKITELKLIEPANNLQLAVEQRQLIAKEGEEVELKCSIISGAFVPSVFYKVAWLYTGLGPSTAKVPLVELDHTGLLRYPENSPLAGLQGRLRLFRPAQSSFNLNIQRAHVEDRGTYQCQVEQFQLDHEGHWLQKAADSAGPITLTVNVPEKNLSVVKEEVELNVSRSQDFTVPCRIASQSSSESKFQVTWIWQKETQTNQRPIFVWHRNATLQDRLGEGKQLRFSHPLPNQFSVTVLRTGPENSGLYSCEVEEWLPSLSHGWRKVAVDTSGSLTVNVRSEGEAVSEPRCQSATWIGILVPFIICSLLVIFLLARRIHQTKKVGVKESGQSLWVEEHPLNTKPSAEG